MPYYFSITNTKNFSVVSPSSRKGQHLFIILLISSGDIQRKTRDPYPTEMTHDEQSHRLAVSRLEPISYQGLNNKEEWRKNVLKV